jgi:hypothetical protein
LKEFNSAMSSTLCWSCRERPSSRVGGLCSTCWKALGKPDRDAANALRAAAQALPEGAAQPLPPLSTDSADTLAAMRHVVRTPATADTTHQQKSMREWREASPASFYGRLADLEKAELATRPPADLGGSSQPVQYDGEGPCPTCHREPDPYQGKTNDQVIALLADDWAFQERIDRHTARVLAFMDAEGLQ